MADINVTSDEQGVTVQIGDDERTFFFTPSDGISIVKQDGKHLAIIQNGDILGSWEWQRFNIAGVTITAKAQALKAIFAAALPSTNVVLEGIENLAQNSTLQDVSDNTDTLEENTDEIETKLDVLATFAENSGMINLPTSPTSNETNVKTGSGKLYGLLVNNEASTACFIKFYDKSSAATSADTPKLVFQLAAGGTYIVSEFNVPLLKFVNGLRFRVTRNIANTDTSYPNQTVHVNILYT